MIKNIYLFSIWAYGLGIRIAALFSAKAKKRLNGQQQLPPESPNDKEVIWMHCASLGEFEQGRPVLEAIRKLKPQAHLVLSFFSPSGYEVRKSYPAVDVVCYLPLDTPRNVRSFLEVVQPDQVFFVKYEFWAFFLQALKNRGIPSYLISARFRPNQIFFKSYGGFFRQMLQTFDKIFVQDTGSRDLLESISVKSIVCGDTRVDRVASIGKKAFSDPILDQFVQNHPILVAGSTWPQDEALLLPWIKTDLPDGWKVIIAPHEIHSSHVKQITDALGKTAIRYTQADGNDLTSYKVLILDTIGMLSQVYGYGQLCYIGGGFGAGIHNTLEPMAHGLPVIFGPKYQKFPEAVYLVLEGGGQSIDSKESLEEAMTFYLDESNRKGAADVATAYIWEQQGATNRIMTELY